MKKFLLLPLLLLSIACKTEPVDEVEPNRDLIKPDTELYSLLDAIADTEDEENEDAITCITFIYPMVVYKFDENDVFLESIAIQSNQSFITLLDELPDEHAISISYPIVSTNANGETVEINNNQELQEAIEACIKDQVLEDCEKFIENKLCVWDIENSDGSTPAYNNSQFKINNLGAGQFYHNSAIYFGTFTFLFINEELHLNIFINDETLAQDWNFDWKASVDFENNTMELTNNEGVTFNVSSECNLDCEAEETYQECETQEGSGTATFNLTDYLYCFDNFAGANSTNPITYSFHTTQEDALNDLNAVSPNNFSNTDNPQTIYTRITDLESNDYVLTALFTIEAVACED